VARRGRHGPRRVPAPWVRSRIGPQGRGYTGPRSGRTRPDLRPALDQIWLTAPAPGLRIRIDSGAVVGIEPNGAALAWAARAGLSSADWLPLATLAMRREGSAADAPLSWGGQLLRVRLVPLVDGLLLWLTPDRDGDDEAHQRLAAAQRTTQFLDRALGLAGVSVWRLDLLTQRIHFNAVGFHIAGMQPDPAGIPVQAMRATIHPDDVDAVVRAAEEAAASDRVVDVVARYRNEDGSWRTLLTRRVADRDDSGRAIALAGVSLDLAAQMREHERAEDYAQRARLVAELIGVGFWSIDIEAQRVEWDEQIVGVYLTKSARPGSSFETYYFHKRESDDPRPATNPQPFEFRPRPAMHQFCLRWL